MPRRVGALVVAALLAMSLGANHGRAAGTIVVDTLADTAADDGACSLREAIVAANTDTPSGATAGECPGGSGADEITFSVAGTITLAATPPVIASDLTIDGGGAITIDGATLYRPITIDSGRLALTRSPVQA